MGDALRDAIITQYTEEVFSRRDPRKTEMPRGAEMNVERELKPLFAALKDRLRYARGKHPFFARDGEHALAVLRDEVDELEMAIRSEGRTREKDEALDVMTVAARYWLGDHLPEGEK